MTMAASTLLFAGVLAAILYTPPAVVMPVQDGDKAIAALIEKLRSNDVAERDGAAAELKKLPLDKLPLLEKALSSDDAEVAGKVREAFAAVLSSAFSRKIGGVEIHALADAKLMKQWVKDGSDRKAPPDGYEAMDYQMPSAPKADVILVRTKPALTVKADSAKLKDGGANQGPVMASSAGGGAGIEFAFTDESDKAYAGLTANNFLQVVVLAEGKIFARTNATTQKTGERWMFVRSKDEGQRVADLFNGRLAEIAFLAKPTRKDAGSPDDACGWATKCVEKIVVRSEGDGIELRVPLDVKSPDLVGVWKALRAIGWKLEAK